MNILSLPSFLPSFLLSSLLLSLPYSFLHFSLSPTPLSAFEIYTDTPLYIFYMLTSVHYYHTMVIKYVEDYNFTCLPIKTWCVRGPKSIALIFKLTSIIIPPLYILFPDGKFFRLFPQSYDALEYLSISPQINHWYKMEYHVITWV